MTPEEQLMSEDERNQVQSIYTLIPEEERKGIQPIDILFVLDTLDDYLEEIGLLEVDENTGDVTYLNGEVDETDQLEYIRRAIKLADISLTNVQIQLILDAEIQYGIEQGYYEDEE